MQRSTNDEDAAPSGPVSRPEPEAEPEQPELDLAIERVQARIAANTN